MGRRMVTEQGERQLTVFTELEEEIECPSCGAEFIVHWDPEGVNDRPVFCPFCGADLEDEDDEYIDDEDDQEDEEQMYDNPWLFDGVIFESKQIGDYYGFVYMITSLIDGKKYIGRKYFYSVRKKSRKDKRRTKSESDWQNYYGSSDELKEQIDKYGKENFRREILSLHTTKGRTNYEEVRAQFLYGVLESEEFINGNINGKWHRSPEHIAEKSRYSTKSSWRTPE